MNKDDVKRIQSQKNLKLPSTNTQRDKPLKSTRQSARPAQQTPSGLGSGIGQGMRSLSKADLNGTSNSLKSSTQHVSVQNLKLQAMGPEASEVTIPDYKGKSAEEQVESAAPAD